MLQGVSGFRPRPHLSECCVQVGVGFAFTSERYDYDLAALLNRYL
jgi:hypothetical protein